jgi:hypothetical protein
VDPTEPENGEPAPAPFPTHSEPPNEPPDELDDIGEVGDIVELSDTRYREWVWWVYRMRSQAELQKEPRARQRVVVTKVVGPLDVLDIQTRFGGGVYEFRGFLGGQLQLRRVFEIEGRQGVPAPPPPAPPPPAPHPALGELTAALTQLREQFARIEAKVAAPTQQGFTISDTLKLIAELRAASGGGGESSKALVKEMFDAVKMGMELRGEVQGGERSTAELLIEKLAPSVERIATAVLTRRQPPPPPPRRTAPASQAEVVETTPAPQAAPAATEPGGENFRIMAAVDAFARAIANEDEPGDFADSLDHILNPAEMAWLAGKSTDELLAELAPVTVRYEVFGTEPARVFIEAVLTELRTPQDDESTSS